MPLQSFAIAFVLEAPLLVRDKALLILALAHVHELHLLPISRLHQLLQTAASFTILSAIAHVQANAYMMLNLDRELLQCAGH